MFLTKKQTIKLLESHKLKSDSLPTKGKILYICSPGGGLTTVQKSDKKSTYGESLYSIETPIIKDYIT